VEVKCSYTAGHDDVDMVAGLSIEAVQVAGGEEVAGSGECRVGGQGAAVGQRIGGGV
jgi:hypothetical protein